MVAAVEVEIVVVDLRNQLFNQSIFMQEIKFQIKGMHCTSCAFLIEENLKGQPGIIQVKVNHSGQNGEVIYDENSTSESAIFQRVRGAGDYQAEKI